MGAVSLHYGESFGSAGANSPVVTVIKSPLAEALRMKIQLLREFGVKKVKRIRFSC